MNNRSNADQTKIGLAKRTSNANITLQINSIWEMLDQYNWMARRYSPQNEKALFAFRTQDVTTWTV